MNEWYYAKNGQQNGPVTFERLQELARSGMLDPKSDLAWNATMKDWTPAGQVPGLFPAPTVTVTQEAPPADPSNPYAAPQSAWVQATPQPVAGAIEEIVPGSEPIDAMACVKRGFDLAKRHASTIVVVGLVYFGVIFALNMVVNVVQGVGAMGAHHAVGASGGAEFSQYQSPTPLGVLLQLVTQVVSTFLGLGATRIGLNLVSGKPAEVGMLFGEGNKLLRTLGASILFGFMVVFGLILFVFPGVYLALRYGQFMVAIVDRDLGVMDSFSYSSSITTNNRTNLFVLGLLAMLMAVAGMLACCVGIFVAMPVVWLSYMAAYRWMQYGHRALMDHPGTQTPMLAGR